MDTYFPILIEQMKIIATLIAIGLVGQKIKLFDNKLVDGLPSLIAKLILPLMLCTIIGSVPRSQIFQGFKIFITTALIYTITIIVAQLLSRHNKLEEPNRGMHTLLKCYGNSGYVGIPLITSIFPSEAGIVAATYILAESFFYWVVGPAIAGGGKANFKKFVSPITLSILVGFVIMMLNLDLSQNIVWDTMKNVGGTCKYFASIYIGISIGKIGLDKIKNNLYSATAAPAKLLVMPILAYFLFGKTGFLEGNALMMFVLLCTSPSGMSLPIVAEIAGADSSEYASAGITISTILCLFTIPFVMWFVTFL